jgi:hypothetical protein
VNVSAPAGSAVFVDGRARGAAPLLLEGLTPGRHELEVRLSSGTVRHSLDVLERTAHAVVVVAPAAAVRSVDAGAVGWVELSPPFDLDVFENGRLIGRADRDLGRITLGPGEHPLEFVNESLGYRERQTVRVSAGKVVALRVSAPNGVANFNALPWAEVWVGDRRIGETPLGNVSLPVGTHDVLFRHPQLGERRERVTVTLAGPARASVDLRR